MFFTRKVDAQRYCALQNQVTRRKHRVTRTVKEVWTWEGTVVRHHGWTIVLRLAEERYGTLQHNG